MDKQKNLENALEKLGITSVEQLNTAIKEDGSLNIGIMAGELPESQKVAS